MKIKAIIFLVTLMCCVCATYRKGKVSQCKRKSVVLALKRPVFQFSIKLLQRISEETSAHFVFSPLTTWLQLIAISEAAIGDTYEEIWQKTKNHGNRCFRRKFHDLLSKFHRALAYKTKRRSIIAIDREMSVKTRFMLEMRELYRIDVMLLDFNHAKDSAYEVNRVVEVGTDGEIDRILYEDDFIGTVMILTDANYFHNIWQTEFSNAYTETAFFYSTSGIAIGTVKMMHQTGYFYMTEVPQIGVKVLEMPLGRPGIFILIFLPTSKIRIGDLFLDLEQVELTTILKLLKVEEQKLVNVALPKFSQMTEIENLSELLYDIGIKRIFDDKLAELRGISDYNVYASVMTQICHVEINERGATIGVDFVSINETSEDFIVNRPFAYMLIDKTIEFILYAGVYSIPSTS